MSGATASWGRRSDVGGAVDSLRGIARSVLAFVVVLLIIAVLWESAKWIGGGIWREAFGIMLDPPHQPPLRITQLNDTNLPHVWEVIGALFEPATRRSEFNLLAVLLDAALFTWRGAAVGFVVGAVRSIGLFGIVELVRNRQTMEPMAPFNGTSDEMVALGKRFREDGLYTFVRWNSFFTNPPLTISEEELAEGFAIIDRALEITDAAVA